MAQYVVNIELENAADADYTALACELSKMYFRNENYTSPNVPYFAGVQRFSRLANIGLQDISAQVEKAAAVIGKKFSFFVIRQKAGR